MASTETHTRSLGQGRPLGLLLAWGEMSFDNRFKSGEDHMHAARLIVNRDNYFPYAVRSAARERHINSPMAQMFFKLERKQRLGEQSEPSQIP